MGGDFFPEAPIDGAIRALDQLPSDGKIVLIGDKSLIESELSKRDFDQDRFGIVHTTEVVEMSAAPAKAIASKPDSSIRRGLEMVKNKEVDAFVSAGNTGAMLVGSTLIIGKVEGVIRPTIGILFPTTNMRPCLLCDVGANVDCKAETLNQFGKLGRIFMRAVMKLENPKVALLNVGEEEGKGSQVLQDTYKLLKEDPGINFIGNIEGRQVYDGPSDVIVTDGYTGNVLLKFGESLYDVLRSQYPGDEFMERFNFENIGGVPILGVKGISMIGHGISTGKAIESMILRAVDSVQSRLTAKIESAFQSIQS